MEGLARLQRHGVECNRISGVIPKAYQVAVERKNVGVRRVLDSELGHAVIKRSHYTRRDRPTGCGFVAERWRINPAIDVASTVIANMKCMHHAIAVKGMIAILGLKNGVRAITIVSAAQIAR